MPKLAVGDYTPAVNQEMHDRVASEMRRKNATESKERTAILRSARRKLLKLRR